METRHGNRTPIRISNGSWPTRNFWAGSILSDVSVVSQDVRFYSHVICPVSHFSPWILVGLPTEVFGFWFVG